MKNYKKLKIITLISHLLIISFIALFIKFEGKFNYIYDIHLIKNTQSRLIDLIFALLLLAHFILIMINLVVFLKIVLKKTIESCRFILLLISCFDPFNNYRI